MYSGGALAANLLRGAGGGGPSGDVTIAVQDFSTPGATGNQDYTTSALGGATPKAALLMATGHVAANDPGESDHLMASFGFITSSTTNHGSVLTRATDAVASTAVSRNSEGGIALKVMSGTTVSTFQGDNARLIADGIRLDWSSIVIADRRCAFMAFAGADVQAENDVSVDLGSSAGTVSVTSTFQPDLIIVIGSGGDASGANQSFMGLSFGIALSDGTQRCVTWSESNGAAAGRPYQTLFTDCVAAQLDATTGALSYKATAQNFGATGFDLALSASAAGDDVHILELASVRQFALVDFTTPTSTGSQSISGAGFTPQGAIVVLTNLEATDATPGSTSANQSGLAVAFLANEQWAGSWRDESAADPTNTASNFKNVALLGPSATDTAAISATLTAWTSNGMTLNYSAVQGTGKKGFILFIE